MFIGVIGSEFAGKRTLVTYLCKTHGFIELRLIPTSTNDASNGEPHRSFDDNLAMLDYATRNWQTNFVTLSISNSKQLKEYAVRPFFLIVQVKAQIMVRFKRHLKLGKEKLDLEAFVSRSDRLSYTSDSLSIPRIDVRLHNNYDNLEGFHSHVDSLNLLNIERLRPGWDTYFMTLAHLASLRSNCMKRRVGAILVRNKRIVATGYNGTPRHLKNCNEGGCARCNALGNTSSGDECLCLHAEENALLEAGRERVQGGGTGEDWPVLYCNTCPCLRCSIKIIQTGVKEVVYNLEYKMDDATARVFREAGVALRQFSLPD